VGKKNLGPVDNDYTVPPEYLVVVPLQCYGPRMHVEWYKSEGSALLRLLGGANFMTGFHKSFCGHQHLPEVQCSVITTKHADSPNNYHPLLWLLRATLIVINKIKSFACHELALST